MSIGASSWRLVSWAAMNASENLTDFLTRAAPLSQNIRKAFEVLVGAARVKKSVRVSEAFIAAHETKRQEDDPMDID